MKIAWSIEELRDALGFSEEAIKALIRVHPELAMPCFDVPRGLFFDPFEVAKWLDESADHLRRAICRSDVR